MDIIQLRKDSVLSHIISFDWDNYLRWPNDNLDTALILDITLANLHDQIWDQQLKNAWGRRMIGHYVPTSNTRLVAPPFEEWLVIKDRLRTTTPDDSQVW